MVEAREQEGQAVPKNLYPRNGIWWARFKVNGVEYRESLRTRSERRAGQILKDRIEEVKARAFFGIEGPKSWAEAVVSWNEHCTRDLSEGTLKRYRVSLRQLRAQLDGKLLIDIDLKFVRDLVKVRRGQGATNATIRRDLTAMSSVIEHAIDEDWMETNPTLPIRRKRLREKRDPIMLPQAPSIAQMLAASPDRFADAQEFARETGMREEEVFGLTHSRLDEKAGTISVIGKGNKLRVIPYTRKAREIVKHQPRYINSDFVFWHDEGERWKSPGSRFTDIRRRVSRKAAQSGTPFQPYRFHDLRHLYAVTYLRERKGSLYDLKELLGHSSVKTTEIYLEFLTPEEKKAAMHGVSQKRAQKLRSGKAK